MTREEALEIIRKNMPSDKSLPVYEALQTLVPELVESDDEKIREEMIRYFTEMKKGGSAALPISKPPFELWKCYESMEPGSWESRAFRVIDAPYISNSSKPVIIVSNNQEELFEIAKIVISEERWETGSPEFDRFKNYYVMFD